LLEFRLLFQDERRRRNILVKSVIKSLRLSIRETDVMVWYKNETVIGVIFSELHQENPGVNRIRERVNAALWAVLKPEQIAAIAMSVHVYPHGDLGVPGFSGDDRLYPGHNRQSSVSLLKRLIDILRVRAPVDVERMSIAGGPTAAAGQAYERGAVEPLAEPGRSG
jgi:hypothetical protein